MTHTKEVKRNNILKIVLLSAAATVVMFFMKSCLFRGSIKGRMGTDLSSINGYISENPNDPDGYNTRGNHYSNNSEYAEAIAEYTKAIDTDPTNADVYYNNRGLANACKEKYGEAITDFSKAILVNPKEAEYYYNRGNVRVKRAEYEGARLDYNKAIEINPNYVNAQKNLSWLLRTHFNDQTAEAGEFQPMGPFRTNVIKRK